MSEVQKYNNEIFERIKHTNEYEQEFWYARDLSAVLQYTKWDNLKKVIIKAKKACENSEIDVLDHFSDVGKMVNLYGE